MKRQKTILITSICSIVIGTQAIIVEGQTQVASSSKKPFAPVAQSPVTQKPDSASLPRLEVGKIDDSAAVVTSSLGKSDVSNKDLTTGTGSYKRYSIGASDILEIRFKGELLKQKYYHVSEDGTIDFPLAGGAVFVAGKTSVEIESAIKSKITLFPDADLSVLVKDRASHSVEVTGSVNIPGIVQLQRDAVPLYVINASVQPNGDVQTIKLIRNNSGTPLEMNINLRRQSDFLILPNDRLEYVD